MRLSHGLRLVGSLRMKPRQGAVSGSADAGCPVQGGPACVGAGVRVSTPTRSYTTTQHPVLGRLRWPKEKNLHERCTRCQRHLPGGGVFSTSELYECDWCVAENAAAYRNWQLTGRYECPSTSPVGSVGWRQISGLVPWY